MLSLKELFVISACLLSVGRAEWRWDGKVAVVTGASSGIGAEIAVALANKGVKVVGLARRESKVKDLLNRTTGKIHAVQCDMSKEEEILSAFRWVEETLGGVDILINNAGIHRMSFLVDGKTSDWQDVINLNVVSLSVATREALKTMRTRGDDGHIININSIVGHEVPKMKSIPTGLYAPSKFAVTALTQSVAFELANLNSKIKVTSLSPGLVLTEIIANITSNANTAKLGVGNEPLDAMPIIQPSDIADGVIYVLSTKPNVQIAELTIQPIGSLLCG